MNGSPFRAAAPRLMRFNDRAVQEKGPDHLTHPRHHRWTLTNLIKSEISHAAAYGFAVGEDNLAKNPGAGFSSLQVCPYTLKPSLPKTSISRSGEQF